MTKERQKQGKMFRERQKQDKMFRERKKKTERKIRCGWSL